MHKELREIAIRIYQICIENKIELAIQWIPRNELQRADAISRFIDIDDLDDWQITPGLVLYLDSWTPSWENIQYTVSQITTIEK